MEPPVYKPRCLLWGATIDKHGERQWASVCRMSGIQMAENRYLTGAVGGARRAAIITPN